LTTYKLYNNNNYNIKNAPLYKMPSAGITNSSIILKFDDPRFREKGKVVFAKNLRLDGRDCSWYTRSNTVEAA